jgi:hypothetical protein
MGQVVSFDDYIPPARYDGLPWLNAQIEEAAGPNGPWAIIDTVSIGTPDVDPAFPAPRDFSTALGTAPRLWYRVVFLDTFLNVSEPTAPLQNVEPASATGASCQQWITEEDVLDCCSAAIGTSLPLATFAAEATELLFELSGRRFSGVCERTVRPCPGHCGCWAGDPLFRYFGTMVDGEAFFPSGGYWPYLGRQRGCRPLSTVKLAGYPVNEIVSVTIDGAVVDPSGYELKNNRNLVRLNDADGKRQHWPGCQNLGQSEGLHTFFVTYTYGQSPPTAGVEAAKQLACELAKACPVDGGDLGDCALPPGTVEVVRQGITIRAQVLGLFLEQGQTGLAHVDAFLAVYGSRARRPAVIWSPDVAPFAQEA